MCSTDALYAVTRVSLLDPGHNPPLGTSNSLPSKVTLGNSDIQPAVRSIAYPGPGMNTPVDTQLEHQATESLAGTLSLQHSNKHIKGYFIL